MVGFGREDMLASEGLRLFPLFYMLKVYTCEARMAEFINQVSERDTVIGISRLYDLDSKSLNRFRHRHFSSCLLTDTMTFDR